MVFATTCCGLFDHHGTNVCAGGLRVVLGNEMSRARAVLWMSTGLTREQMITLLGAQAQITSTSHPECAMLRELREKWC